MSRRFILENRRFLYLSRVEMTVPSLEDGERRIHLWSHRPDDDGAVLVIEDGEEQKAVNVAAKILEAVNAATGKRYALAQMAPELPRGAAESQADGFTEDPIERARRLA